MIDPSTFVNCVVLGVIGWITYKVYIYPYHISPLRKIPGPPSKNLFFGNFKSFITEESGEPYVRWVKQYGSFVKYHGFLNRPSLLISDAKIIQEIVSNQVYNFPKPENLGEIKRIIGDGLFLAEGDIHKRQRKMMNPAFTHINVKGMVPSFIRVAFTLKGLIEDRVNKGESKIIISTYLSKTTLDVIGLVGFNHEFNTLTSPSKLAEAYDSLLNVKPSFLTFTIRMLSNYVPIRKFPIAMNKKFNNACKVISQESEKLMEEKYRNDKLDGNDLLSLLIKINNDLPKEEKMTKGELRDQIMTFLLAGHETTSNSISWALYFLAKHPREQDLLREELVKAFPDKSTFNPTFDEINSLEYLNCIIKETLRLVPAVIGVTRYNTEDRVLGGHFIPKDTQIDIPIIALHRLPSIWGPTADEFDPQRWLNPSLIKNVTNYNYLPFHTGARSCIGSKVATSEFKIVLSMLVRNFFFQIGPIAMKKKVGFLSKPDPYLELIVSNVEI